VDTHCANFYSANKSNDMFISLEAGQSVEDMFLGIRLWGIHEVKKKDSEVIHKRDKVVVLRLYAGCYRGS